MIKTLLVTVGMLLAFWIPVQWMKADDSATILRAASFVAATGGLIRWGAAAGRVYINRAGEKPSLGILGLVLFLLGTAAQSAYAVVNINIGKPAWLLEADINNFCTYLILIGCGLLVVSTTFDGEKPTRLSGVAAACIAGMAVMFTHAGPYLVAKAGALFAALSRALP